MQHFKITFQHRLTKDSALFRRSWGGGVRSTPVTLVKIENRIHKQPVSRQSRNKSVNLGGVLNSYTHVLPD